ncbi:tRNA (N6-isopentenyl adenosine(37)-C2)-methylthiotransferase MiaB [Leptospirillum ferriphilum]|uniref:tRNA-2-methylthio-N(6)-dimethylallyladenosine synthase n=1 Tax=Leptospirillum sp. Group II '5-way CG' TaxID=419541 RepID=B6ANW6_9BACT|nr:MAG: tRNA-i(6)A37 modification enzyme (MiaB) [Leptospirillum sp. Group II '5-way CG']
MSDSAATGEKHLPPGNPPDTRGSVFDGKTFYIKTFGCQMNVHDSERMAGLLASEGGKPVSEPAAADIILVNTCTIRDKADQKALSDLGRIRQVRKEGPGTILAVTGCMAQREGEEIFRLVPDVDLILGPSQIRNLIPLLDAASTPRARVDGTLWPVPEMTTPPALRPPGVSAFVTVQEGCDKACAYCVVPATRGPERSRPVADILREAEDLVSMGFREITLLGQNVNGYGQKGDTAGASFPELLQRLSDIPGLLRIRFTTSHPMDMSDALINVMATSSRVMPHLHLPVQSGSDRMLERMQRGYTLDDYRRWIEKLRKKVPEAALTTDLIVGFCGETEEDFEKTLAAVEEFRFDGAFAFIYSPRPSTPAHSWEDIPPREVSVERLERLQKKVEQQAMERNQGLVGSRVEILTEKWDPETRTAVGRTPQFLTVRALVAPERPDPSPGDLLFVTITQGARAGLKGNAVSHA